MVKEEQILKYSRAITVVGRFLVARKPALSAAMKPSDIEVMKVINLLNSYNVNKS